MQHGPTLQATEQATEANRPAGIFPGTFAFAEQNVQTITQTTGTVFPPVAFLPQATPLPRSSRRTRNRKAHSKAKPIPKGYCHYCGKGFARANLVERHLETACIFTIHTEYPCLDCLRIFPRKDSLKRHRDDEVCGGGFV